MVIPDYETLMLPLLELASQQQEITIKNAIHDLAAKFDLSEREKNKMLPSGMGRTFLYDRAHWAMMYLKHAGLLERTKRGHYRITNRGHSTLNTRPKKIDKKYLIQFREFKQFIK